MVSPLLAFEGCSPSRSALAGIIASTTVILGGVKQIFVLIVAIGLIETADAQEAAPKHEIGLTLGRLFQTERSGGSVRLDLGSGTALQANYGYRLLGGNTASLYGEIHFLANPLREVSSADRSLTRDVATIFLTPGVRLKLYPKRNVSPYFAAGAGLAVYEQSLSTLDGRTNPASRVVNHGAFNYGAGLDFKLWRFIGLRAEVRDFYAASPSYNTRAIGGGQHNVVAGGGFVLRFR